MTTITVNQGGSALHEPSDDDIAAARQLGRQWGWLLAGGLVSMLVGIAVLSIRWDIDGLATFAAVVFAIRGVAEIASSGTRPHRGAAILSGALGIIVALIAFAWPGPTLFVLATLTGIWLMVWGVMSVIISLIERGPLWGLWLITGVVAIPLGSWALAHPDATMAVIVAVIGLWAIAGGLMEICAAFEVRKLPETLEARRAASPSSSRIELGRTSGLRESQSRTIPNGAPAS